MTSRNADATDNFKRRREQRSTVSLTLAGLQDKIKRDPMAYETEFLSQLKHFETVLETLLLKPQKPAKDFDGQVMFLAHVTPYYKDKMELKFGHKLINLLEKHYSSLHPATRKVLVQAVVLLRNREQFELIEALPLYFKLLSLEDKGVRGMVFAHIVRDIQKLNEKTQNQLKNRELQRFLFEQVAICNDRNQNKNVFTNNAGSTSTAQGDANSFVTGTNANQIGRRVLIILITLYKKNIWTSHAVVNEISKCVLNSDIHIAKAAINFLLGIVNISEEGDEKDEEADALKLRTAANKMAHQNAKNCKTAKRQKKLKVARRAASKAAGQKQGEKRSGLDNKSFAAIDVLHDPQVLAERLLTRVVKSNEPYAFRLLVLQLTSRLIGRHELLVLNFYGYLMKYLTPSQREVTVLLACLAQACHGLVPPHELQPMIKHIMQYFVSEACQGEVITVGINALREVACRCPLALNEEQVFDICGMKKNNNKGVRVAVKSLVNMYRELNPEILHRTLRGRDASMAIQAGEVESVVYGSSREKNFFADGVELLAAKKLSKEEKAKGEDDEGADGETELPSDAEDAASDAGSDSLGLIDCASGAEDEDEEEEGSDEEGELDEAALEAALENGDEEEEEFNSEEFSEVKEEKDADEELGDILSEEDVDDLEQPKKRRKIELLKEREEKKKKVEQEARNILMDTILGPKDFARMKKLQTKKAMQRQLGRKTMADDKVFEDSDSSESDEEIGEDSEEEEERRKRVGTKQTKEDYNDLDFLDPSKLTGVQKRKRDKDTRLQSIKKGREGAQYGSKKNMKDRAGGSTNKEKNRNKPSLMIAKSRRMISKTKNIKGSQKLQNVRNHVKSLKKNGGKKKRR